MMNWKFYKRFIKLVIIGLEKISPYYLSVNTRIKIFDYDSLQKYPVYNLLSDEFAIVMQGKIVFKDNFTLETLKLYRHIYPHINIILSTWMIDDRKFLEKAAALHIKIIQNTPPAFSGLFNINLQITSTINGLKLADEEKAAYILKVRTDQRCCKPVDFLRFMRFLQVRFPLTLPDASLKERLVIISLDTLKNRLYGITDMFMFGTAADMLKYWDVPLDTTTRLAKEIPPETMIQYKIAEGYFVNHFFKATGFNPDWTINNSNQFLASYFCIVDKEQVDLFWFKYNRFFESLSDLSNEQYKLWIRNEFVNWSEIL